MITAAQNNLTPLFIGLPGAGKSTLSQAVAQRLGMEVIGTDPLFRVFRAVAATSDDPKSEVMRRFLARAQTAHADKYSDLARDAETIDAKGRCALHDSVRFRAYGETVFRLYEIEMLRWLHENSAFAHKIVDLSASAPLFEENRKLFSAAHGYCAILVDTPQERIAENLLKDYETYLRQSAEAGEKKPVRGAYEKVFDDALAAAGSLAEPQRRALLLQEASRLTAEEAAKRMQGYRAFAAATLTPSSENLDALVEQVLAIIAAPARAAG